MHLSRGSGDATRRARPRTTRYRIRALPEGFTVAFAIGADGTVVGEGRAADGSTRAVAWRDGQPVDVGTLGGSFSTARGISDTGQIVGASLTSDDERHHGFVSVGGEIRDLNDLLESRGDWEIIHALGVSAEGAIVALASREGRDVAVLLEPVDGAAVDPPQRYGPTERTSRRRWSKPACHSVASGRR